ncbi:MAG: hypothetical protein FWC02_03395 [Firmicutes bacterium]|nr:hypothetical protein [Bacillota bacterium]
MIKGIRKSIVLIGVLISLLVGMVVFSACWRDGNGQTLEQRLSVVERQINKILDKDSVPSVQINMLLEELTELRVDIRALGEDNSMLLKRIANNKTQLRKQIIENENGNAIDNYERHPNSHEIISDELEIRSRKDFIANQYALITQWRELNMENFWVDIYFGTFNNGSIMRFGGHILITRPIMYRVFVEDMEFLYHPTRPFLVWNYGVFYRLEEAFKNRLLSIEDVKVVYYQRNESNDYRFGLASS